MKAFIFADQCCIFLPGDNAPCADRPLSFSIKLLSPPPLPPQLPPGSVAAALALQAQCSLGLAAREAEAGGDAATGKRLVLEARWAAAGSLRELGGRLPTATTGGGGRGDAGAVAAASLLLGRAELARGRAEKAVEEMGKVGPALRAARWLFQQCPSPRPIFLHLLCTEPLTLFLPAEHQSLASASPCLPRIPVQSSQGGFGGAPAVQQQGPGCSRSSHPAVG